MREEREIRKRNEAVTGRVAARLGIRLQPAAETCIALPTIYALSTDRTHEVRLLYSSRTHTDKITSEL